MSLRLRVRYRLAAIVVSAGCLAAAGLAAPASQAAPVLGQQRPSLSAMDAARAQLRAGLTSKGHAPYDFCASAGLRCQASYLTASAGTTKPLASSRPIGYGADDLARAYSLTKAASGRGIIAILDAGAYPTLEADLKVYRSTYHLPACTVASKCLTIADYKGGKPLRPSRDPFSRFVEEQVAVETALDVQMASAACPSCRIVELQLPVLDAAPSDQKSLDAAVTDFGTATRTAVQLGASAVSISYGYPTDAYTDRGAPAKALNQPGVAIVASSGDSGFTGPFGAWPQSLPTVISAGGTSLYQSGTSKTGFSEVAWSGAGSGCTPDVGPASGQPASISRACGGKRVGSDISAVADPTTGVAVYDSYAPDSGFAPGFLVVGGTSASAPFIAGLYARASVSKKLLGPNRLYSAPKTAFTDVTLGQNAPTGVCKLMRIDNRVCTAGPGWDGPTGLGTPKGLAAFH
jgi:hypothetical protein